MYGNPMHAQICGVRVRRAMTVSHRCSEGRRLRNPMRQILQRLSFLEMDTVSIISGTRMKYEHSQAVHYLHYCYIHFKQLPQCCQNTYAKVFSVVLRLQRLDSFRSLPNESAVLCCYNSSNLRTGDNMAPLTKRLAPPTQHIVAPVC